MNYTIAAFTIRERAISAYRILIGRGLPCKLINTPRAAGLGCGLSVQFGDRERYIVYEILNSVDSAPDGFYSVSVINNKTIVVRL